ncbi:hypothetical protein CDAIGKPJ_03941 [Aeromonas salmonicida]
MQNKLIERLRGSLSTLLYFFNTLFWCIPIFLLGILKLLLPLKGWRTLCNALLDRCQQPDPENHHRDLFRGGRRGQRKP